MARLSRMCRERQVYPEAALFGYQDFPSELCGRSNFVPV